MLWRGFVTALVLTSVWGAPAIEAAAGEETSGDSRVELKRALRTLSQGPSAEAGNVVYNALADPSITTRRWETALSEFFEDAAFTPAFAEFWVTTVASGGEIRTRALDVSLIAVRDGLSAALDSRAQGGPVHARENFGGALLFLHHVGPALLPGEAEAVLRKVDEGLAGRTGGIVPVPGMPAVRDPVTARLGIQLALTLAEYGRGSSAGRTAIAQLLGLPGGAAEAWVASGVYVFDNGGLSEQHAASLYSLLRAIPMELHRVVAVIDPESTGVHPGETSLLTSGRAVFVERLPMGRMTDPKEFPSHRAQPVAPEFTIRVAQQMVRAIQENQIALRPVLAVRRDAMLANARDRRARYLRQTVPPAVYLQRPEELFPSVATLWFINTELAYRVALDLFHLGQKDAMDQFLLMADLLSGGGGETILYQTSPSGMVSYTTTRVARDYLPKIRTPSNRSGFASGFVPIDVSVITGIQIMGQTWRFELNDRGGAQRYFRQ